jgi:hypothetical protein
VRRVFNRAFFDVGDKVMWLFVWKIAPPFPLEKDVHRTTGVLFLACMRKVFVSNLGKDSAYSEVDLDFLGIRRQTVLIFTLFLFSY